MATVREFISEALSEISGALLDFDEANETPGLSVFLGSDFSGDKAPPDLTKIGLFVTRSYGGNYVIPIQFDLMIEVSEGASTVISGKADAEGKASFMRVVSGSAEIGASAEREKSEQSKSAQHVKFSVPLQLPNEEQRTMLSR